MIRQFQVSNELPTVESVVQTHRVHARWAWRSFGTFVLALSAIFPFIHYGLSPVSYYGITLVGLTVWLLTKILSGKGGATPVWLEPPVLIGIWIVITWGIPGIVPFFDLSALRTLVERGVGFSLLHSAWAISLVGIGILLLDAGFGIGRRLSRTLPFSPHTRMPHIGKIWVLYLISVLVRALRIGIDGVAYGSDDSAFGAFAQVGAMFDIVPHFCLALGIGMSAKGYENSLFVPVVVVIELIFGFTSGMMKPVVWLVLVGLVSMNLARINWTLRHKWALVVAGLGGLVAIVVVVPISEVLRILINENLVDTTSLSGMTSAIGTAFQLSWGRGWADAFEIFQLKAVERQSTILHIMGIVLRDTPDLVPFQGLGKLLSTPFMLVPRALWPDKPLISQGAWLAETYLGYPTGGRQSSALGFFLGPYIDAGWLGVLIGLIGLGIIIGIFFHRTIGRTRGGLILGQAAFLGILPFIMDAERDFQAYFLGLIQWWVIVSILWWAISVSVPNNGTSNSDVPLRQDS